MSDIQEEHTSRFRFERKFVALLFVILLSLYFFSLPMTLPEGDAGEWTIIARYGGIPHPSGYPLYAVLCRLFGLIAPPLPLVTALALLSAVAAAIAASLSYKTLFLFENDSDSAVAAVVAAFTTASVWRMANTVEPFGLNLLLATGVFYCASLSQNVRPMDANEVKASHWPLFTMGGLFGLGVCNHHTLVWMLPFAAVALWSSSKRNTMRRLQLFTAGFCSGLIPLVYFYVAQDDLSPYNFFKVDSLNAFVRMITRADFGSFQLAAVKSPSTWEANKLFFGDLPRWYSFVFLAVAIFGLFHLPTRGNRGRLTCAWIVSFGCASVLFLRLCNLPIEPFSQSILYRFMALPTYLLVYPLFFGVLALKQRLVRADESGLRMVVFRVFLAAAVGFHIAWQWPAANRSDQDFFERHIVAEFKLADKVSSTIVSASDNEILGQLYGRFILGLGSQTTSMVFLSYWTKPELRLNIIKRNGLDPNYITLNRGDLVARLLQERGRILVVDPPEPPRPAMFQHSFPVGPAIVLVRAGDPLPTQEEIVKLNELYYQEWLALPSCELQRRFSGWDYQIWLQHLSSVSDLETLLLSQSNTALAGRITAIKSRFEDCQLSSRRLAQ